MPSAKRVLLIEPDAMLRASLAEQLRAGEYDVVESGTAEAGLASALDGIFEFAVVDGGTQGGHDLSQQLRDLTLTCPILVLTDDPSRAGSKDNGADETLLKPFRFGVLLARANALTKSHARAEDVPVTIGPYQFRPNAKLLVAGRRKIRLTEKEADILAYLKRAGATVSRETLLHEVWGYNPDVSTHTLETHIYRLRQKIERDPAEARILVNDGGGYRLGD